VNDQFDELTEDPARWLTRRWAIRQSCAVNFAMYRFVPDEVASLSPFRGSCSVGVMLAAPASWVRNIAGVIDDGANKSVTIPATNSPQFFRLRRQ
jgi:hypothetical protein